MLANSNSMTTSLSRAPFGEKKNEPTTIRLTDAQKSFVVGMVGFKGFESESDYIRFLVKEEMDRTVRSLNLMADALGVKVITENIVDGEKP